MQHRFATENTKGDGSALPSWGFALPLFKGPRDSAVMCALFLLLLVCSAKRVWVVLLLFVCSGNAINVHRDLIVLLLFDGTASLLKGVTTPMINEL